CSCFHAKKTRNATLAEKRGLPSLLVRPAPHDRSSAGGRQIAVRPLRRHHVSIRQHTSIRVDPFDEFHAIPRCGNLAIFPINRCAPVVVGATAYPEVDFRRRSEAWLKLFNRLLDAKSSCRERGEQLLGYFCVVNPDDRALPGGDEFPIGGKG